MRYAEGGIVMIDKPTLIKLAKLYNLRPWQQEKRYLQSLILAALSEHPLVFKGGTYLYFFHGLDRFSEDLDFTSSGSLPEALAGDVSESLRLFGVQNSARVESDDMRGYSFRIGARGPLYTSPEETSYVYVEISRREHALTRPMPLRLDYSAYGVPVKMLGGMALEEVAAEKVRAIVSRDKARDLYDLAFLVRGKGVRFDRAMVEEKLAYYGATFDQGALADRLDAKEALWKPELKPLIFGDLMDYRGAVSAVLRWAAGDAP